jgi:uncharacterized protein YeaO (DUF488 family)
MIKIQRVYEYRPDPALTCFLVDRLWPRGIKKEKLQACQWLKEVAPSNALRNWYGHDPQRWEDFQSRYFSELDERPYAWQPILESFCCTAPERPSAITPSPWRYTCKPGYDPQDRAAAR